ncbi:MAG: EAL domain-containing protein [Chloroflexi bacterium]|nr:MAG: EAL domain-containing protein [Chloroflexota bacterium]
MTTPDAGLQQEIHSLAAEIVHAYEELHLLYELGQVLTSDLGVSEVTSLIVEKILQALTAGDAELRLASSSEPVRVSRANVATAGPDHRLSTTLRSAGEIVGGISLARSPDDEPFSSADGKLLDAVGTLAANAIRNAQLLQELRSNEAHLRAVLDNVAEGIITVDEANCIASFNPAAERIFGYAAADVIGGDVRTLLDSLNPGETIGRQSGDRRFAADVSVGTMRLEHDQPLQIFSVRDITRRKEAEAALEHQALHDALTDLPNRVLLHDRLQQAIRAADRNTTSVALLVMDLDRFKEVNDTFGHHTGDQLLEQLGQRLGSVLRASDTIARLGGDEFAVLLPTAALDEAQQIADRLLQVLEQPFTLGGLQLEIDASIGIALSPDHGHDADTLLRRADVAMYVAKRGNVGHAVYTADQDQHSPMRLAMVSELRRAIDQNELSLYFQPKVSLAAGSVTCAEALVRWQHPRHGLLGPDLFVPIAEQTGLIRPLARWVLDAALRQCSRWRHQGLDLAVAVNLSMRNLHDPEVVDTIRQLLTRWGIPPSRLVVEITESSLMADAERAMDVLGRLRAMGVGISIDDFGTGYSSLAYLKRLPVDELKIDKSFVAHIASDDNDAAIVRSTIGLAHDLGLAVVAEGIEDEVTWDYLAGLGCDVAQGYFISRPLPVAAFGDWLATTQWKPQSSACPTFFIQTVPGDAAPEESQASKILSGRVTRNDRVA